MKKNRIVILVLSDSHGSTQNIREALKRCRPIDAVIFLGDGVGDLYSIASSCDSFAWLAVRGNCDYRDDTLLGRELPRVGEITLLGKRIVFTHGDVYGVKFGMDGLFALAEERKADVVLYGHTHRAKEEYLGGVYYFNPGSVGATYGEHPTAGVLTIEEGAVLFSFLKL